MRPRHCPVAARPAATRLFAALPLFLMLGCANPGAPGAVRPLEEIGHGLVEGYLEAGALPDSFALLPPAPSDGSLLAQADAQQNRGALEFAGTPRWEQARIDADIGFPGAEARFACALDAPVSEAGTPHLYWLLRRTLTDAGLSTYRAKRYYRRERPFMVNGKPVCTPEHEAALREDGSYPSGHAAAGWAWALVLSELAPERADAILQRGYDFGHSRVICNVHWPRDVEMGRVMGAATVARLHGDAEFRADLEAARRELAALRARGMRPAGCDTNAAAPAAAPDPQTPRGSVEP